MNPFPGLRPFRQDEDYLFFGREEQTMELLQRLGTHRFVAVVGTSGSGKSSLVRCGLLSVLLGGKLLRAGASWQVAVTHPGGNPLALLAEAILEAELYDRREEHAREHLLATLSRSHFGLIEAIKQARLGENVNFLLVVDQFEEVFRFNEAGQTQQEAANEFVSLLLEAVAQTVVPIYVVLTMRSDFIGDCGQFEGLAEMVNRGEFLIPRLNREQFKRVIEAPIKVAGGQIMPRLLQRLLNDLGQQTDQLPCLQHALMRTWSVWSGRCDDGALDLADYQSVGGMSDALSLHADEVFHSLANDRQRELCAGMFKALTIRESEKRGTRRPQRVGALCQILEVSAAELRPIIDAYRQPYVTFLTPSSEVDLADNTIIDISHESLMRVWTRLRRWVEEEVQAVGIYRRLSESALLHEQGKAGPYRDPELGIALAWREASRPNEAWAARYHAGFARAMSFLDTSRQARIAEEQKQEAARQRELEQARTLAESERARAETETRAARRLRALLAATALIAVFAIGASLVAVNFWRDADRAKQAAEKSEQLANENAESAKREADRATAQEAIARDARQEAEVRAYTASLAAAAADLQRNDSRTLRRRLEQAPERMRGWEWAYLWNESDRSLGTVLDLPPEKDGYQMDLSGDGKFVASRPQGGHDKPITIYDTRSGAQVAVLKTYPSSRPLITFSTDNRLLAYDHWGTPGVQVYEIKTGRELVSNPWGLRSFLGFDPPGERAVVCDDQGKVRVFKTVDWSLIAELPGDLELGDWRIRGAVSPNGKLLAIGSFGTTPMRIYDFSSNKLLKEIPESTAAAALQFSDTNDSLTTMSTDGVIATYKTPGWQKAAEAHEGKQQRGGIAVHRLNGDSLHLSFQSNGAVAVFDPDLTNSATLRGHGAPGSSIAVDAESHQIVSAHIDGAVCRWDLFHPRDLRLGTRAVAFTPAGTAAYAGLNSSTGNNATQVCAVDVTFGLRQGYLRWYPWSVNHSSTATQMAFSPDGRRLAVSTASGWGQGRWRVYDLWTGIGEYEDSPTDGDLECIAWSADGKWVAVAGGRWDKAGTVGGAQQLRPNDAGRFRIYDASTYQQVAEIGGHDGAIRAVTFSPDNRRLISGADDGTLRVWEVPGGKLLSTIGKAGDSALNCVVHSPDGSYVVAGSTDGTVSAWNPLEGKELFRGKAHGAAVTCLSFTPDGSRLATAAADRSLKIFDPAAWRELLTLHLQDPARAMSFSPDGKRLALAGGSLLFLDTESEKVRSNERQLAREGNERARPLVQRVLEKTTDPLKAREMILAEAPADEVMGKAALEELREKLDLQWSDAYKGEKLEQMLARQVLRQQLVLRAGRRVADAQRNKLLAAIQKLKNLDAIQRQAFTEYANAKLNWEPDTVALAAQIVFNANRSPDDYLLAYFGMVPIAREGVLDPNTLLAMAMAEYRVGLFADALDSAEHMEVLFPNTFAAYVFAVKAMCQHKLGRTESAKETMRRLGALMHQPAWSANRQAVAWTKEARQVVSTVDKPWNEQAAWESCKARMEQKFDAANCPIWQAWYLHHTALKAFAAKDWLVAAGHLERLAALEPMTGDLHLRAAWAQLQLHRPALALRHLWMLLSRPMESATGTNEQRFAAMKAVDKGDWPLAAALFCLVPRKKMGPSEWQARAWVELATGDLSAWRETCRQLFALNRDGPDQTFISRATVLVYTACLGRDSGIDPKELVALAGRVSQKDPQWGFRENLGAALYRGRRSQDAVRELERVVKEEGKGGTLWTRFFLAMAHHQLGHTDKAREWRQKAALEKDAGWEDRIIHEVLAKEFDGMVK
jgi:WD40 repeat protein